MSDRTISPEMLGDAIKEQLTLYRDEKVEQLNAAGERAVKKLVSITKKTAPARTGKYYKAITSRTIKQPTGNLYVWGVKAPHHRLTHLLVKGYALPNGGRTSGDPFLSNALNTVLPEYESDVEEVFADD